MAPRTKKERIFRHMARDTPSHKVVRISRDELLNMDWRLIEETNKELIEKYLGTWVRFMKIKHNNEHVKIDLYADFDIDYNMYRFGGAVYALEQKRVNHG